MRNDKLPATGNGDRPTHDRGVPAGNMGLLGGPGPGAAGYLYGLDFQLDSGHGPNPDSEPEAGALRVYEMDYVPPGRAAMRLARIYVTGDVPCHIMNRARGTWLRFEAATERWYLNSDALAAMVEAGEGGKVIFRIAHERCRSGTSLDDFAWAEVPAVVAQVAPRDVAWRPHREQEAWPSQAFSFSLSSETPAHVAAREGCLLALRLTVTEVDGGGGRSRYRIASTEWAQGSGRGALFAGWHAGDGVVLERSDAMPAGIEHTASCALELASGLAT